MTRPALSNLMKLKSLISRDLRNTALNQIWRLVSGPLILLFIPLYLSAEAQGYWYTFISLAALAIFADMGFSAILLLFSSHEFAHLKFAQNKTVVGDEYYLSRLASLWIFAAKWSISIATLFFPIVLIFGYFVLNSKSLDLDWKLPWLLYGVGAVLVFVNSMLLSFVEGCDSVGDVQSIRFKISVVNVVVALLLLFAGAELYALALSLVFSSLFGSVAIFRRYSSMFSQLADVGRRASNSWWPEIKPLIWRYSLSWVSGYFIFSIFTPLTFHFYTAVQAGQVGLSIALCTAIFSISNVWMVIVTPKMSMHIAKKDFAALNTLFYRHLFLSMATFMLGCAVLYIFLMFAGDYFSAVERLVSIKSLTFLLAGWFFQLLINALALYLRAHKIEPLVLASIFSAVYVASTTVLMCIYMPFDYLFLGFLSVYIWVFPWVFVVFRRHRRAY